MLNGLYVATSGLMMQSRRVENIANNLANVNTAGYKKDVPVFTEYFPTENEFPQNFIRTTDYNKAMNSTVKNALKTKQTFPSVIFGKQETSSTSPCLTPKTFFTVETPFGIRYTP
ncbi:MAG: flagellar basal body protein [Geovibrio sp.]|nr:flagellar basal body protein [Geovibrio sp.]